MAPLNSVLLLHATTRRVISACPKYVPARLCYAHQEKYACDVDRPAKRETKTASTRLKSTLVVPINDDFIERYKMNHLDQPAEPPPTAVAMVEQKNVTTLIQTKKRSLSHFVGTCAALSKARLTGLVVSTALAGCALAAPTQFACEAFLAHPATSLIALGVGTGLTSGAANTINQVGILQLLMLLANSYITINLSLFLDY